MIQHELFAPDECRRVAATADVAPDNAEAALWALKTAGVVERTIDVPVLWRLVR